MKNILIVGATGQIGSELALKLRKTYGGNHVIAGYIAGYEPKEEFLESGPAEIADITNPQQLAEVIKKYKVDTIYNLAALLSAVAESKPMLAWHIGVDGLLNVLELAREHKCAVFTPSSIGSFGPSTPADKTPQYTIQRPQTIYGISKVTGELLSDYYYQKYGVDARSVRYPGLISNVTLPGGGTTDYAVDIYYSAVRDKKFECPLKAGTFMDMMYMPDALDAAVSLMEVASSKLKHRNAFNITAMSFDPEILAAEIRKHIPDFTMTYKLDKVRQAIADSWPNSLDDSCAREEWGWNPKWNLENMTVDMLKAIEKKYKKELN
jgi:nucleoside-diphosphate-sugar epimerase